MLNSVDSPKPAFIGTLAHDRTSCCVLFCPPDRTRLDHLRRSASFAQCSSSGSTGGKKPIRVKLRFVFRVETAAGGPLRFGESNTFFPYSCRERKVFKICVMLTTYQVFYKSTTVASGGGDYRPWNAMSHTAPKAFGMFDNLSAN